MSTKIPAKKPIVPAVKPPVDLSGIKRLPNFRTLNTRKIKIHDIPATKINQSKDLLDQFQGQDFGIISDETTLRNFIFNRGPAYVQTKDSNFIVFGFDGVSHFPQFITTEGKKKLGELQMEYALSTITY